MQGFREGRSDYWERIQHQRRSRKSRERINRPRRVLGRQKSKSQSGREGRRKGCDSWSAAEVDGGGAAGEPESYLNETCTVGWRIEEVPRGLEDRMTGGTTSWYCPLYLTV